MTSLATPAQLASRLQMDVDTSTAQDALDGATAVLCQLGRQQFVYVSQETIELRGGERVLTLPERPLDTTAPLTVTEVGEFGAIDVLMIEDRDFVRIGNELTRGYPWWWNATQRLMGYPRTRPIGVWAPKVRVTYSHGYQTVPSDLVAMTLDIASVLYDNPTGLRQLAIDDYSETKSAEVLGAALYQQVLGKLGMAGRRRRAFSVRTA